MSKPNNVVWSSHTHHIRQYRDGTFAAYRLERIGRDIDYTLLVGSVCRELAEKAIHNDTVIAELTEYFLYTIEPVDLSEVKDNDGTYYLE